MKVKFFQSAKGSEPVRRWLKDLSKHERRIIGEDIEAVRFGWPMGPPLVKKIESRLWEVRSTIARRETRIMFTIRGENIVLLHGFMKKTQSTPKKEIETAKKRAALI